MEQKAEHLYVRTEDVVRGTLWRRFPVINVDKVKDIPSDYPGAMGVPITYLNAHNPARFELLGCKGHLKLENGREPYQRVIIRNLKPDLPEVIDIAEWLRVMGVPVAVVFASEEEKRPEDYTPEFAAPKAGHHKAERR